MSAYSRRSSVLTRTLSPTSPSVPASAGRHARQIGIAGLLALSMGATGTASAEAIAKTRLGIDLEDTTFWHSAIDLIERELEAYERDS